MSRKNPVSIMLQVISPLHTKGLMMLVLVFLSESITVSNAVSEWTEIKQKVSGGFAKASSTTPNAPDNGVNDGAASCPSTAPVVSRLSRRILSAGRRNAQKSAWISNLPEDCCSDCSHCMDPADVNNICHMSRGGHIHTSTAAAEGVADAIVAKTTPYGLPLHYWKVIFQAILTTINVLCWLIPLKSKQISENKLALSLANAFSGGVFLSLAFGHLIPECVHGFDAYPEAAPYLLVLVGYLIIFFVEKVAFDAHDILHEMEHAEEKKKQVTPPPARKSPVANGVANAADNANGDAQGHSGRSALILLGALGVHSVLEMMALGLSNSFGDSALLTLSIALHQPAESIALLVAFLKSGMPHDQILQFLSIFSCMGPIGVALGMAVNEYAAPIVDSVMLAIVAGTFVYVGATEVIPEEWEDSSNKWKKFSALMSGIVSILVITQYTMSLGKE